MSKEDYFSYFQTRFTRGSLRFTRNYATPDPKLPLTVLGYLSEAPSNGFSLTVDFPGKLTCWQQRPFVSPRADNIDYHAVVDANHEVQSYSAQASTKHTGGLKARRPVVASLAAVMSLASAHVLSPKTAEAQAPSDFFERQPYLVPNPKQQEEDIVAIPGQAPVIRIVTFADGLPQTTLCQQQLDGGILAASVLISNRALSGKKSDKTYLDVVVVSGKGDVLKADVSTGVIELRAGHGKDVLPKDLNNLLPQGFQQIAKRKVVKDEATRIDGAESVMTVCQAAIGLSI